MCNCCKNYKNLTAFLFMIGMFTMFSSQASAQLWFGGGLAYGEGIENLGLQANGHLVVNEENKIRLGADVTYFFGDKVNSGDTEIKTNLFAINFNGHYMLVSSDALILYGIGGLNIGFVSIDVDGPGSQFLGLVNTTSTEIGLNIGGGVEYGVEFGRIYAELKYILGGFDQLVIGAGVRIPLAGGR